MGFLELTNLRKVFPGGTEAVKGSDLSVPEGEFVVLLGPSGCGKTTTLRMIAGLEKPTDGRIMIRDRDVTGLRAGERDVGFVFQFYALYPHLTVRENIMFPLRAAGMKRGERDAAVSRVTDRFGLSPLLNRHPPQLSGGDQQRVSLARALVRRPDLYLMDEPLGTLDADKRLEMREFIRAQQLELKVTTVYVTHDQEEAMSLADRVVVMDEGRIRQQGTASEVYDDPSCLFVARFVGSPGMNFVEGEVEPAGGTAEFRPAGSDIALPLRIALPPGPVVMGIRPEYLEASPAGALAGTVVMNEYMGSCRLVHVDTGFGRLVMRMEPDFSTHTGARLGVELDTDKCRFFDVKTGDRVASGERGTGKHECGGVG